MASAWTKERGWRVRDAITRGGGGGDWAQKQNRSVRAQFNLRLHGPGRFTCCIVWWVRNVQDKGACTRELVTKVPRFSNLFLTTFWTMWHVHNRYHFSVKTGIKRLIAFTPSRLLPTNIQVLFTQANPSCVSLLMLAASACHKGTRLVCNHVS